jgi:acyl carrier protein
MMSINEEIINLVRLELGFRDISESDRFFEDLGIDSSDLLNVIVAVEEKYGIAIAEEEILDIRTISDLATRVKTRTE